MTGVLHPPIMVATTSPPRALVNCRYLQCPRARASRFRFGKVIARNRGADSFRDLKSAAKTGAGHDNDEFVAAKPAQEIGFADDLFRASGEAF